jgi:hypothetical protein
MALDPAQLTSRSNSDLCFINLVADDVTLSPEARMELIAQIGRDWGRATSGSTGRFKAKADALRKWPSHAHLWRNQRERRTVDA